MPRSPLAELIVTVAEAQDPPLSLREVSRRAKLSPGRVQQLVAQERYDNLPTTHVLRGLAAGLRLPLSVVVRAALESAGLPYGSVDSGIGVRDAIAVDTDLTAAERRDLTALYDSMTSDNTRRRPRAAEKSGSLVDALEAERAKNREQESSRPSA